MSETGFTNDAIPALSVVESPIEGRFVQAFFDLIHMVRFGAKYRKPSYAAIEILLVSGATEDNESLLIQYSPLWAHGRRYDFAMRINSHGLRTTVIVELDGKAAHSTPEQNANDKHKDRLALLHCEPVLRFSGYEVYSDAKRMVVETLQCLESIHRDRKSVFGYGAAYGIGASRKLPREAIRYIEANPCDFAWSVDPYNNDELIQRAMLDSEREAVLEAISRKSGELCNV